VKRLLRVLALYWTTSLQAELEYRGNFVLALLASCLNLTGTVFTLFLFSPRNQLPFPGWSFDQSLVVLGIYLMMTGVASTVLAPNLNRLVISVQEGTLDFVLLRPFDSQLQVSFRALSPWGLPDLGLGTAVLVIACTRLRTPLTDVMLGVVPLLSGMVILYALWFTISTTCIWFVRIYNATEVLRGLLDAGRFPITAFPEPVQVFFKMVVPVAFLTTVPAEVVLGRGTPAYALGSAALALVLVVASRAFWRFALRSYTSASS
jgi:ABC-2 type transport system permease protein